MLQIPTRVHNTIGDISRLDLKERSIEKSIMFHFSLYLVTVDLRGFSGGCTKMGLLMRCEVTMVIEAFLADTTSKFKYASVLLQGYTFIHTTLLNVRL